MFLCNFYSHMTIGYENIRTYINQINWQLMTFLKPQENRMKKILVYTRNRCENSIITLSLTPHSAHGFKWVRMNIFWLVCLFVFFSPHGFYFFDVDLFHFGWCNLLIRFVLLLLSRPNLSRFFPISCNKINADLMRWQT